MARINPHYATLQGGYLFPEIARRTKAYLEQYPGVKLMRLGIGNTTEPLTPTIVQAMTEKVQQLGTREGYKGYGDEQGETGLREALATYYSQFVSLDPSEFFISDGAKCDVANVGSLFSDDSIIAVEDPAYPVYVDSNVIAGRTGKFMKDTNQYLRIVYMPCKPENGFFPALPKEEVDIIYLCRPNNPTGATATVAQLQPFVDYALGRKVVLIYDAAYAFYQKDPALVRTIYQVPGAEHCAIEISSCSKWAGFTGVRLGWAIVSKALVAANSIPGELHAMWNRRQCTMFNGASNIAQAGGLAALTAQGQIESQELVDYYMGNAEIIRCGLARKGLKFYGGTDAPFVWVETPGKMPSWEFFDKLLEEAHVVCTPGAGFGPSGEGFIRLSAFGHTEDIAEAVASIQQNLQL